MLGSKNIVEVYFYNFPLNQKQNCEEVLEKQIEYLKNMTKGGLSTHLKFRYYLFKKSSNKWIRFNLENKTRICNTKESEESGNCIHIN